MAKIPIKRTSMVKANLPTLDEVNQNVSAVVNIPAPKAEPKLPIFEPEQESEGLEVTKLVRLGEEIHTIAKTVAARRKMKLKEYMEYLIKKDNPDIFT